MSIATTIFARWGDLSAEAQAHIIRTRWDVSEDVQDYCRIDTWAHDRDNGEQGLTSVTYLDADEASQARISAVIDY